LATYNANTVNSVAGRTGNVVLSVSDIANAASLAYVSNAIANLATYNANTVNSVAGRTGNVVLSISDIANAAPLASPIFTGNPQAPTPTAGNNSTLVATTAFVATAIANISAAVTSVAGRTGNVVLSVSDVANAASTTLVSTSIANAIANLATYNPNTVTSVAGRTGNVVLSVTDIANAANISFPIISYPTFLGYAHAPNVAAGDASNNIATTAFVSTAISNFGTYVVQSVAGRTGNVILQVSDVNNAVSYISPTLIGTVTIPTYTAGDNSTKAASTAFVNTAISFLTNSTATTQALGNNTNYIATTAFVHNAIANLATYTTNTVNSVAGRTGNVVLSITDIANAVTTVAARTGNVVLSVSDIANAAPLASPAFTGTPTAPTPTIGNSSTVIATTAFVSNAIANLATYSANTVNSVAGRTGNVILSVSDIANAAPLASPAFTGTPTAPTPTIGNSSTVIATTAFVHNAIANLATYTTNTVNSVAGRTGNVVLSITDIANAAPLASPIFTGIVQAPTPTVGNSSNVVATTAFVSNAIAGVSGASSYIPTTTISSSGASQTLTYPSSGSICIDITLTANCTLTLAGGTTGQYQTITLILRQDSTAGRVPTLPSGVRWPNSTAPTPNSTAGKIDVFFLSTPDGGTTIFGNY
jgi:hypothetical protein